MALFLTESDVGNLLTMPDAIAAVEDAFLEQAAGTGLNPPRQRVRTGDIMLHVLPGGLSHSAGLKVYCSAKSGTRFWTMLFDATSGDLVAMIQADLMGQIRTGAASGVATRYMANPEAAVLGLFGTGKQAITQAAAVCAVRPIRLIKVWGRDQARAQAFAGRLSQTLAVEAVATADAQAVVRGSQVICTITKAAEPVFDGAWLEPGTHINAAGSNRANAAEVDPTTVRRAALVAVDLTEQARGESGDLIAAAAAGAWDWNRAVELHQIVTGQHPGRNAPADITLFESHGISLWDLSAARKVVELARQQGVGQELPL